MDQNRLVDLILWGVMLLGGALLGLVYVMTSDHDGGRSLAGNAPPTRAEMPREREAGFRASPKVAFAPEAAGAAALPKDEMSPANQAMDERAPSSGPLQEKDQALVSKKVSSPASASSSNPKEAFSGTESEGPGPGSGGQDPGIRKPTERRSAPTPPLPSPGDGTIQETTNANGTIYSAQEIGEGTIVGKRGAADDVADFYRIRATGKRMRLRLEPSIKDQEAHFVMIVFDEAQRSVGEHTGGEVSPLILEVKPQLTYFIKLDLRKAPINTTPYRLSVHFE